MASALQHCPACQEEYVAGVASCVECGGPLQPGPLERSASGARRRGAADVTPDSGVAHPDRLLAQMPGLQADHAVRTLLLEGITCGVECQGIEKVYAPDQPPAEPFAITLPVSVYVTAAQHEAAQEVLASFHQDDVIGDQWSDASRDEGPEAVIEGTSSAEPADDSEQVLASDQLVDGGPTAESTSMRTVVLIILAAVVLLFLFGR